MKNTTASIRGLAFAICGLLSACALFSNEKIDGCMYRRSRLIDVRCINDLIAFSSDNPGAEYPMKDFVSCVRRESASAPAASPTLFLDEGGGRSVKAACLFEEKNSRNYYRWEEESGRLYVRYLSCAAGCASMSDVYGIEFSDDGIKAVLLGTAKE
jgi:hypothetical protein